MTPIGRLITLGFFSSLYICSHLSNINEAIVYTFCLSSSWTTFIMLMSLILRAIFGEHNGFVVLTFIALSILTSIFGMVNIFIIFSTFLVASFLFERDFSIQHEDPYGYNF